MTHRLRTYKRFYEATLSRRKMFEVRRDSNRNFSEGDILILVEVDEDTKETTGREMRLVVDYIVKGPFFEAGLPRGTVVMGLKS